MILAASRYLRKMRGGTQAHLLEATDQNFYVVKFLNNPQHRRILVNEWIGSALLRYLGIATPKVSLIHTDERFLAGSPDVSMHMIGERLRPTPGPHFGSCYPGDPRRVAVYDFLPDPLLERVKNLPHFQGVFVFDKWTSNADSRQAIFFRSHGQWIAEMNDQGLVFGGSAWRFRDSPIEGSYFRPSVYRSGRKLLDCEPWLHLIHNLPFSVLEDSVKSMPTSWLEGDESHIWRLVEQLLIRRKRLPILIEEHFKTQMKLGASVAGTSQVLHFAEGAF